MLAIFFPHMYEDIEYLLPAEELVEQNTFVIACMRYAGTRSVLSYLVGLAWCVERANLGVQ